LDLTCGDVKTDGRGWQLSSKKNMSAGLGLSGSFVTSDVSVAE
jgi:hypothetical protein